MDKPECKLPRGTKVAICCQTECHKVFMYLHSCGCANPKGYSGTGNRNIGLCTMGNILYHDDRGTFINTITFEAFAELCLPPVSEDNYLTFN